MKPLLILTGLSLLTLVSELLNFKKFLLPIILAGLALALAADVLEWNTMQRYYNDMMYFDNYAAAFTGLLIAITLLWFLHSSQYFKDRIETVSDKYALVLFCLIGGVILSSFSHMVMLFIGIEILSLPLYILAGSRKNDVASNEAAMKYFLLGSFAAGFLLFGIALIYGATGSFHIQKIFEYLSNNPQGVSSMFYVGMTLMTVGIAFKVSAVPFHFWTPDVYQGAPTIITTYMATAVKTAGFAAFFRLFAYCFVPVLSHSTHVLWAIAALTILVGNITAVYQNNVKRMLAYSSIAHAGYIFLAILAMNKMSASSILLYTTAYSVSTIAAFTILLLVIEAKGNDSIDSFNGLAKNNPFMAFIITVAMLSLAGIPPTAGFFAKYFIFSAAMQSGYLWLVLIAVLGSLIGVYYYFRIIIAAFKTSEDSVPLIKGGFINNLLLVLVSLLAIGIGLFPNLIVDLI